MRTLSASSSKISNNMDGEPGRGPGRGPGLMNGYSYCRLWLLVALVLQNALGAVVGKVIRTAPLNELFCINHFLVTAEFVKLVISVILEIYTCGGLSGLAENVRLHVFQDAVGALKGSFAPAFLYLISNSMQYVAMGYLSVPLFQVLIQVKLIMTAIVSVLVLNRMYTVKQWVCLLALSIGVAIVTTDEGLAFTNADATEMANVNLIHGISALAVAVLASSLASVYLEMVLKQDFEKKRNQPSLWLRNMMLSLVSVIIGLVQSLLNDLTLRGQGRLRTFFHGFTWLVWLQIALLSFGGLLVAAIMKYADSVVKGIATGVAVALSSLISAVLLGTKISQSFCVGTVIISFAILHFSNSNLSSYLFHHTVVVSSLAFVTTSQVYRHISMAGDEDFPSTPYLVSPAMPSNSSIRFHVSSTRRNYTDCGGCLMLDTLVSSIKDLGYNVTDHGCPDFVAPNDPLVIFYNEFDPRCVFVGHNASVVHVHWILAPVGIHSPAAGALANYNPDDIVFNYGMWKNDPRLTLSPVPATNVLMLLLNPYSGDDTDPEELAALTALARSGLVFTYRKAFKFHNKLDETGKLPHEVFFNMSGTNSESLYRDILRGAEYFVSYDPYTYWSWLAAMFGAVSVIHPFGEMTKEEWVESTFLGPCLKALKKPINMPGLAYGWSMKEVEHARKTMNELRPLLLECKRWGQDVVLPMVIRDCYRHMHGEREHFEGALLAKKYYDEKLMLS